jgi:hypothetical protein
MAKKQTTSFEQRKELFKELQSNASKAILNRIYTTVQGSEKTIEQLLSDDAITPNSINSRRSDTVINTRSANIQDCVNSANEQEIADILDRFVDELIVFGSDTNKFCEPTYAFVDALKITDADKEELKNEIEKAFNKVYRLLKFSRHNIRNTKDVTAVAKEWLTLGKIAYFVVYDNVHKPTTIKDIIKIDLQKYTLIKHDEYIKQNAKESYTLANAKLITYWSLHENTGFDSRTGAMTYNSATSSLIYSIDSAQYQKNIFADNEIILTDWLQVEHSLSTSMSYVSLLLRPFNVLRIMERTKIIWAVMNSRFRTMYTIPVKGKGRIRGKQTISEVMKEYKDNISFNNTTGQISINGQSDLPFNKEIWLGETSSGTPQISQLNDRGPDFSDMSQLLPFNQKLQKASKLPMSRFEDNTAMYWESNPMQISLEERRFSKYVDRVQQIFVEPIRKAMYTQLLINNTKYIGDLAIYDAIAIKCNRYSAFETMMELELLNKTIEMIAKAKDGLTMYDDDGRESPLIATKFLVNKYLPLTKQEKEANTKYIKEEQKNIEKAQQNNTLVTGE